MRAAHIRRLLKGIGDPQARKTLTQMADELEAEADALAADKQSGPAKG